jgi:hypothetical protein
MEDPNELLAIGNEFQRIFGENFGKFIDMRFLLARRELVFNLLKFTDWLEERYPDECSIDGVSYNEVVERKFGNRGVKMIKKLIGGSTWVVRLESCMKYCRLCWTRNMIRL